MAEASNAALSAKPPLDLMLRLRLSLMMFLQFAIWGSWGVMITPYLEKTLGFSPSTTGGIVSTMALGTIFAPLFIGQIADRYFASERLMAILHLLGAGLLYWMAHLDEPAVFYFVALAYALVYSPTLALSNSITFTHVPDGGRDFPGLRVLGTIGWIAAGWILGTFLDASSNQMFLLAACFSLALGIMSLFLPHTPPPGKAGEALPFLKALGLLKESNFAVFFGISFVITIVLAFYYISTSVYLGKGGVGLEGNAISKVMTIGQGAELVLLPFLPIFLSRWGMKWVLALGMLCWGIRYLLFALFANAGYPDSLYVLVLIGIALHGICFDFFFAAGFIHVDNTAPPDIRGSAQSLYTLLTYGLGMWLGTMVAGFLGDYFKNPETGVVDWGSFWLVPSTGVLVCFAIFVVFFHTSGMAKRKTPRDLPAELENTGSMVP
jgi:nucleoside transporter